MIRKKIKLVVVIITIISLSVFLFFFFFLPMGLLGPEPRPLFLIFNSDDDNNHTVTVEIFNSDNISVYYESFDVPPDDNIKIDRGFDWCPKHMFYWFYWDEGSYTFYVTLDNTYNESYHADFYPVMSIHISVYMNNVPLRIGAVTM